MRRHWAFLAVVVIFVVLQLVSIFTTYHLPSWDESVYLGMGKYLYSCGTAGLWENLRPIGWPLFTGLVWVLGINQIATSQLVMVLFALGCIILTYVLALRTFNTITALLAVVLTLVTPTFFTNSHALFSEIPSIFFVLLALYLYTRHQYLLTGIAIGCAFLMKYPHGIMLLIIGISLIMVSAYQQRRVMIVRTYSTVVIGFVIIAAPLLVFNYLMYRNYWHGLNAVLMPFVQASAHQNNIYQSIFYLWPFKPWLAHAYNVFFYVILLVREQPILLLFFIAFYYYITRRWYRDYDKNGLFVATATYLIYLSLILNKQVRFLPLILPLVSILTGAVLSQYLTSDIWKKSHRTMIARVLLSLMLLSSILYGLFAIVAVWHSQTRTEPPIINELYRYFDVHNISGPILTTDPRFSVYSDQRNLPIYNTLAGGSLYVNPWERDERIHSIVYTESCFPCFTYDTVCIRDRYIQYHELILNRSRVAHMTYEGIGYEIWV